MVQEAFKKRMLNSHDYYQAKRWEGKPWSFKLKFMYANYPEFALFGFAAFVFVPTVLTFRYLTFNWERDAAFKKYKMNFSVVRDDDPDIVKIKEEKEIGRQYFPK